MEVLIKLNTQTAGRDKIARLLQYLTRVVWHRLQTSNKEGVHSLKNLEFQLSTFRKLLRFGRCIDVLYSTLPVFQHQDFTIRLSVILSKICNALFLLADHFLWLGRADVCKINTDKWSKMSNKYWLFSITMNLIRDFYEINCILKLQKSKILPQAAGCRSLSDYLAAGNRVCGCIRQNPAVFIDTIKNTCDFFIPLNALGHIKISPGTVGWLGVVSSIAGLYVLIEPLAKLTPC